MIVFISNVPQIDSSLKSPQSSLPSHWYRMWRQNPVSTHRNLFVSLQAANNKTFFTICSNRSKIKKNLKGITCCWLSCVFLRPIPQWCHTAPYMRTDSTTDICNCMRVPKLTYHYDNSRSKSDRRSNLIRVHGKTCPPFQQLIPIQGVLSLGFLAEQANLKAVNF